jgi:GT2 family glycosyltransferase
MTVDVSAPLVAVIIINWRAAEQTLACLREVRQQDYPSIVTIVVENGSGDGSATALAGQATGVTLLALPQNLGFAGGVNRGIAVARAHGAAYVLLLNNDAYLPPDTITRMVDRMQRMANIGIAAPKVYYPGDQRKLWGIGGAMRRSHLAMYGIDTPDVGQYDIVHVDFVFGCAMIIRMAVIDAIGGMDERYFMYSEDCDFCLRAARAGYDSVLFADLAVTHEGSASTRGANHLRDYYLIRSRLIFLRTYLRWPQMVLYATRELMYLRRIGQLILHRQYHHIPWYLKGLIQGLCWPLADGTHTIPRFE